MGLDRSTARRLLHHPRVAMAVKASIAATAAWLVAQQMPGVAKDYALYAPFGAVATTYSAVAQSASAAVRTVSAIMVGAGLGVLASHLPGPGVGAIAFAVGFGVVLAGVPWFGENRAYVPVAAMFVLLIGQGHPIRYATSYAGLFLLGAALSVAINAIAPSLPLQRADRAIARLRHACTEHLRAWATALDPDGGDVDPPDRASLGNALAEARAAVDEMRDAARANRRARRDAGAVTRRADDFRALHRAVLLIDDLQDLSHDAPWGTTIEAVPDELRIPLADALRELAATTAEAALTDSEPGRRQATDQALARLVAALRQYESHGGSEAVVLVVSAVVTTVRRSVSALTPHDRILLSPAPLLHPGGNDAARPATDGHAAP